MPEPSYLGRNRAAWNRLVESGSTFSKVATDDECARPLEVLDGRGWLPKSVAGMDVLCLAAGGGWQSILYAAAGANVTVVDLSPAMLALDSREAERRGCSIRVVEASMDDLGPLGDSAFDIVHQPVSTCYVPDVAPVYREIARVLSVGGLYISQHKQPTSLQISHRDPRDRYVIGLEYYREGSLPDVPDRSYREERTAEYLHRWEQLVGGLCEAGFVIEALSEPYRGDPAAAPGEFQHRGRYVPPYLRMKARRVEGGAETESPGIWTP